MRKYLTTILLILSIFIAESHSYLGRYSAVKQNWILALDRTMELSWNVKLLSDQINAVIYFFAMYFYIPNKVNKTTVTAFIILCFIDMAMYFHNYKTLNYGSVYVWVVITWVCIFYIEVIKHKISNLWHLIKQTILRILGNLK